MKQCVHCIYIKPDLFISDVYFCSADVSYLWIDSIATFCGKQGYREGGGHSFHSTPPPYMYEFLVAQPSFMLNELYIYIHNIRDHIHESLHLFFAVG